MNVEAGIASGGRLRACRSRAGALRDEEPIETKTTTRVRRLMMHAVFGTVTALVADRVRRR
jgi:hypothetical protein